MVKFVIVLFALLAVCAANPAPFFGWRAPNPFYPFGVGQAVNNLGKLLDPFNIIRGPCSKATTTAATTAAATTAAATQATTAAAQATAAASSTTTPASTTSTATAASTA